MNLDEMWKRLAQHQPFADERGYGPEWAAMCEQRTAEAASWAAWAAWATQAAAEMAAEAEAVSAAEEAVSRAAAAAAEAETAVDWIKRAEGEK